MQWDDENWWEYWSEPVLCEERGSREKKIWNWKLRKCNRANHYHHQHHHHQKQCYKRENDNKKSRVQCIPRTPSRISILYNKARLQISNNFCLKTLRNGNSNNIFVVRVKNRELLLILNLLWFAILSDPRSNVINSVSQYRSDVLISASSEHCWAVIDKCDLSDN